MEDYAVVLMSNILYTNVGTSEYAFLSDDPEIVKLIEMHGHGKWECPLINMAVLKGNMNLMRLLLGAGAKVNAAREVIGAPLHVACSDYVPNRPIIVQTLLEHGADTNPKVFNPDGTQLPPPLATYIKCSRSPSAEIVSLLLRYGAKVIMKSQAVDPEGILNELQRLRTEEYQHIFYLLLDAAESFDLKFWNNAVNDKQKEALMLRAKTPISLLGQTRLYLRRYYKAALVDVVPKTDLPKTLQEYLLFNC